MPTSTRPGQKGDPPTDQALGRSRCGFSTELHLRADGHSKPLTVLVTAGQCHEVPQFAALMEQGAVKRGGRGRPRQQPKRVVADKGHSSKRTRRYERRRNIRYTIPRRRNERRTGPFDRAIYRTRNRVERLINRLKQFRRVTTRYEKYAENHRAIVVLHCVVL